MSVVLLQCRTIPVTSQIQISCRTQTRFMVLQLMRTLATRKCLPGRHLMLTMTSTPVTSTAVTVNLPMPVTLHNLLTIMSRGVLSLLPNVTIVMASVLYYITM